jgi:hypothetical protein
MSIRNFVRSVAAIAVVAIAASSTPAAVFDQPTTSNPNNLISGTSPSGLSWAAVATGTALPIRSSGTQNLAPGAVAYWNVNSGQLQIDPKGWNISLFNFTYTTGTVNTSGSTAGPLVYATGTSPTSATVSGTGPGDPLGQRELPAGTWTLITCAPARIAGTVSLVRVPTLATNYAPGYGAGSGSSPYSTNPLGEPIAAGWMAQPWAFPNSLVNSGSVSSMIVDNWKVFGVSGNANANLLGYGNYRSVFQYTIDGVVGNMVGAVIPVSVVPEPSTMILAGVGIAAAAGLDARRRQRRKQAPALTHEV